MLRYKVFRSQHLWNVWLEHGGECRLIASHYTWDSAMQHANMLTGPHTIRVA